jgi:hypothetical protein
VGGGVKKCFLGLWQTALLSAEGKKKPPPGRSDSPSPPDHANGHQYSSNPGIYENENHPPSFT